MLSLEPKSIHVPELYGDFWFNSEPISIRAMRGSVIVVDFWDYSCVNCVRTLPYLKEWYRKYREFDFLVIGVHTPEFKFARNPEEVEASLREAGIEYPVVMDNEALIWSSFANRAWPTKYLIDKDGYIRYTQQGEGGYERFERNIQTLLMEAGYRGEIPGLMEPLRETDYPGVVCYRPTGEIQAGYLRGTLGNQEGYNPESTLDYADHGYHLAGRFYLQGKWFNEREFIRFDGAEGEEGQASLLYEALEVNAVMQSGRRTPSDVFVLQDGLPLTDENAGSDIRFDENRKSYIRVAEPRMFNLIRNKEFGEHRLRLVTASHHLSLYSFTFVTSAIPDLISRN